VIRDIHVDHAQYIRVTGDDIAGDQGVDWGYYSGATAGACEPLPSAEATGMSRVCPVGRIVRRTRRRTSRPRNAALSGRLRAAETSIED